MVRGAPGTVISKVSGEAVQISGEKVYVENQSGQALWVLQSGLIDALSGLAVVLESGTTVNLQSGETITAEVSGQKVYVENQSGQALRVLQSGAILVLQSGSVRVLQSGTLVVDNSGVWVEAHILSGSITVDGTVSVSGAVTVLQSGTLQIAGTVSISGGVTVLQSGPLVTKISGETVDIGTPTSVLIQKVTIGAISGGIQLTSGITVAATVKAASWNSGDIYLGGSNLAAGYRPYSGVGMQLDASEAINVDIDNFNRMYAFASYSGDQVLVIGVAK